MRKVKGGKGGEIHLLEKGETANPNGRPKGTRNRATIVREWLETMESYVNPITKEKERLSQADIITLALINKARKGDVAAFKELMDSCFGKIANQIDVNDITPIIKVTQEQKDAIDKL